MRSAFLGNQSYNRWGRTRHPADNENGWEACFGVFVYPDLFDT